MSVDTSADPFTAHRNLLFTVAYELLGSAADAEDAVQEAWLKWDAADQAEVHNPRAYLVRIVTRTALDHLRTVTRRREDYVGPWLPEPLLTSHDVAEDVELAESVSMAMLLVLETLSPTERAVFVLREVFGLDYDELADAVDKSQDAVRQIAHRARSHVTSRRPRTEVSRSETEEAVAAFRRALQTGDLQALADTLAPDVVALADGGGVKQALPRPVQGAEKVAKLYLTGMTRFGDRLTLESLELNGWPALLVRLDGEVDSVLAFAVLEGRITGLYGVRNPEKLSRLTGETVLSR